MNRAEQHAAWYLANREDVLRKQSVYFASRAEDIRARRLAYRLGRALLDPENWSCRNAYRHAKSKWGGTAPTYADFRSIWLGACFSCKVRPARGVDHIIPWVRGGLNALSNMQPACLSCNVRKAGV